MTIRTLLTINSIVEFEIEESGKAQMQVGSGLQVEIVSFGFRGVLDRCIEICGRFAEKIRQFESVVFSGSIAY